MADIAEKTKIYVIADGRIVNFVSSMFCFFSEQERDNFFDNNN